jgi:hypothetical protein
MRLLMSPPRATARNRLVSLLALGAGGLEPRPALVDTAPGAGEDLPAGGLGLPGDLRDLRVWVAEDLAEEKHGAFGR